ncbi:MAG: U32 family peptidase [Thermodesulfobacteriota bacterium]
MTQNLIEKPEILAPAGGRAAFLAAIAAGADAVYCGLKHFSARMAAENFTVDELSALARLAREKRTKVYVALNTLVKPDEMDAVGELATQLARHVKPDGLIVSDLAMVSLASQAGFAGEIHLSTLANAGFPSAMKAVSLFPSINRVVVPRELSVDEIRKMADACPPGLSLEVFVHGALCYAVSGRCYWSSYLGGKSGLRGNCVQPCRRMYAQGDTRARLFSCQDLWVDVLTKVLMTVPNIAALKIEGRKKGPHYVFYTVKAYRLLRDHPGDNEAKKTALACLSYAMGRGGTHYNFLSQRQWNPIDVKSQTASGQLVGKIQGTMLKPYVEPQRQLFAKDILRIGYEDEPGHKTVRVSKSVPKRGRLFLNISKKERPVNKTPVFLIDRREPDLLAEIETLESQVSGAANESAPPSGFRVRMPASGFPDKLHPFEMHVARRAAKANPSPGIAAAVWVAAELPGISASRAKQLWWWLPPVVWPDSESAIKGAVERILKMGGYRFVVNAPWQTAFFPKDKKIILWAGPFCNTANPLAAASLAAMGCRGVIVSPELGQKDFLRLAETSPLPLGIVVYGSWPLCISRAKSDSLAVGVPFASPKKERAWVHKHGDDYWVYPEWPVDLRDCVEVLKKDGYRMFVHINEPLPKDFQMKNRPGRWNWDVGLK